jgi:hypothetical protein
MSYERQRQRASDPHASATYLTFAAKKARLSGQWGIRRAIALNPATEVSLLQGLSADSTACVRGRCR